MRLEPGLTLVQVKLIDQTAFKSSCFAQIIGSNGSTQAEYCSPTSMSNENSVQRTNPNSEQGLADSTENETESVNVRSSLLSANYLLTLLYFTLGNLRNVTFPAWYLPWLQWSIPEGDDKEDLIGKI